MDTLTISRCSISAIETAPNIGDLLAEYSRESAVKAMGEVKAERVDWPLYHTMEGVGMLHCLAAVVGGVMVGFLHLLVSPNAHFSVKLAAVESIFVAEEFRSTGAGIRLIHAAESIAAEQGAVGIMFSSPVDGRLVDVLPRMNYDETSRVFFRRLA